MITSYHRLLNVTAGWQNQIFDLTLVFEYIDQDLSTFLSRASEKGLARDTIKVSSSLHPLLYIFVLLQAVWFDIPFICIEYSNGNHSIQTKCFSSPFFV